VSQAASCGAKTRGAELAAKRTKFTKSIASTRSQNDRVAYCHGFYFFFSRLPSVQCFGPAIELDTSPLQ
jgi:hypothetical protein